MQMQSFTRSHPQIDAQQVLEQLLPWDVWLSSTLYGVEHLVSQFGSVVLAMSPPSHLCIPQPAIAKTWVYYQLCFGHKSKTQHPMGCSEEN